MITALLTTAAVSKAPFYIAGAVLAIYAVVLATIGITRSGFPGERGVRVVMLLSFVLVVITIAMAIHTSTFD